MIIAHIICFVNTYFYIFEHKFSTKIKFGTKQRINEMLSQRHYACKSALIIDKKNFLRYNVINKGNTVVKTVDRAIDYLWK